MEEDQKGPCRVVRTPCRPAGPELKVLCVAVAGVIPDTKKGAEENNGTSFKGPLEPGRARNPSRST